KFKLLPPLSTLFPYTTLFRSSSKMIYVHSFTNGKTLLTQRYYNICNRLLLYKFIDFSYWFILNFKEVIFVNNIIISIRIKFNIRSEEHTSELQSQSNLVCRLL